MIGQGRKEAREDRLYMPGVDRMIKWVTLLALYMVINKVGGQWFNMCTSPKFWLMSFCHNNNITPHLMTIENKRMTRWYMKFCNCWLLMKITVLLGLVLQWQNVKKLNKQWRDYPKKKSEAKAITTIPSVELVRWQYQTPGLLLPQNIIQGSLVNYCTQSIAPVDVHITIFAYYFRHSSYNVLVKNEQQKVVYGRRSETMIWLNHRPYVISESSIHKGINKCTDEKVGSFEK